MNYDTAYGWETTHWPIGCVGWYRIANSTYCDATTLPSEKRHVRSSSPLDRDRHDARHHPRTLPRTTHQCIGRETFRGMCPNTLNITTHTPCFGGRVHR